MVKISVVRTRLFGSDKGQPFDDFTELTAENQELDEKRPISAIYIRAGWVIDGFNIDYAIKKSASTSHDGYAFNRGSTKGGAINAVRLNSSEVVSSVFGRAGFQKYYKCEMINCLGFTIFDRKQCSTRTVGPFGNADKSNSGESFYTGALVAFGGFTNSVGISGLFMYEREAGFHKPVSIPRYYVLPTSSKSLITPASAEKIPNSTSPEGHIVAAVMFPFSSDKDARQVVSKFIVVAKFTVCPGEPALTLSLLVNTDIVMPRFKSKGATEDASSISLVDVIFHKQEDVTGFARFWGTIGEGELHFSTNKNVVVSGPIEGGPSETQTFIGSGTWLIS